MLPMSVQPKYQSLNEIMINYIIAKAFLKSKQNTVYIKLVSIVLQVLEFLVWLVRSKFTSLTYKTVLYKRPASTQKMAQLLKEDSYQTAQLNCLQNSVIPRKIKYGT